MYARFDRLQTDLGPKEGPAVRLLVVGSHPRGKGRSIARQVSEKQRAIQR
jgi:hypothetical protein